MINTGRVASGMIAGLILLSLAGYFVLRTGSATNRGSEMNVDRAVFNVTNAVTLTGFQLNLNINEYKGIGQATIFLLTVGGSLVILILGGWGLVRAAGMPHDDETVLRSTVVGYPVMIILAATVLSFSSGIWPAIFNSTSAISNSGLAIGAVPRWDQIQTHLVILPLSVIGGLGVPVLLNIVTSVMQFKWLHRHTLDVLLASALIYLLGTAIIGSIEAINGMKFSQAILLGSTETLNSRSLGMPLESFNALSRPSQWVAMLLMLIGASPGGTGGGIKAFVIYAFFRDSIRLMRGEIVNRIFGFNCLWIVLYLSATFTTTLLLMASRPQVQADRMLFLAVSAIGNVGTSHEPLTLSGSSLYILSSAMFFGRIAPLMMLWLAATSFMPTAAIASPQKPSVA